MAGRSRSPHPTVCDCTLRHQHGTRRMYVFHKCGCFPCRVAHARSQREWREGRTTSENRYVDGTGTRRRIAGLAALGFSHVHVADELGCRKENVAQLREAGRVHVATAARVAEAFTRLLGQPFPTGWRADRTRREAACKGWLSPMVWDYIDDPTDVPHFTADDDEFIDEIAVERLMSGTLRRSHQPEAFRRERTEAVRRLAALGMGDGEIACRVDISPAGVFKIRLRNDIPRKDTAA